MNVFIIVESEIILVDIHITVGYKTSKKPNNMNNIGITPNKPSIIIYNI